MLHLYKTSVSTFISRKIKQVCLFTAIDQLLVFTFNLSGIPLLKFMNVILTDINNNYVGQAIDCRITTASKLQYKQERGIHLSLTNQL